jgi:hypothetical integral membrane protein (TIGR02206 family)
MDAERFVLFGPAHLAALVVPLAVAVGLCRWVRRDPSRMSTAGPALAGLLLATLAFTVAVRTALGSLRLEDLVPLQMCDLLIFVAAFTLLRPKQLAYEVLYFWACSGTFLAMVTPAVPYGPPNWHFFTYFGLHGGVVVAAVLLTWGAGMRPQSGAPLRVFLLTNLYAAFVGGMNVVLDENFLFLCRKPAQATLLDAFGPWPIYLLVAEGVALLSFVLLSLPLRARRPQDQG